MATTTNYGWTTPDDTALVKDGAAAIRTLGSSVDTTTKALNPSTTLGDIEYRSSTSNTNTRLGIGTNGQVLTVATGVPSWATPAASGGMTLISTTTFDNSVGTYTLSSIPGTYKNLVLVGNGLQSNTTGADTPFFRFNGITTASYAVSGIGTDGTVATFGSYDQTSFFRTGSRALGESTNTSEFWGMFVFEVYNYADTSYKAVTYTAGSSSGGGQRFSSGRGQLNNTGAVTSITFATDSGANFKAGTVRLYGVS